MTGGRGRGRGGGGAGASGVSGDANDFHRQQGGGVVFGTSPGTRGRGFMRRPFQHGGQSIRGGRGGFKSSAPFTNHGVSVSLFFYE